MAIVSRFTTVASAVLSGLLVQGAVAQERRSLADVEPREVDLPAWREHLEPAGRELRWESIGWLPTFGEGLLRADREGKPLLLWTMNGHPLGCT
ncbi:MAG: hypothetical protein IH805_09350 [Proteobacteria bacterium]|nr:hypothetical protein [Pseudomonadota bacterium]